MPVDAIQLRDEVVYPVLKQLGLYSEAASSLVMGTIAQESAMGSYLRQLGGGPALGICQMEPTTFSDIHNNFLVYRPKLLRKLEYFVPPSGHTAELMVGDLYYAVAMCRIHYLRAPASLPAADNVYALGAYWKKWYNTPLGAGRATEFVANYQRYLL